MRRGISVLVSCAVAVAFVALMQRSREVGEVGSPCLSGADLSDASVCHRVDLKGTVLNYTSGAALTEGSVLVADSRGLLLAVGIDGSVMAVEEDALAFGDQPIPRASRVRDNGNDFFVLHESRREVRILSQVAPDMTTTVAAHFWPSQVEDFCVPSDYTESEGWVVTFERVGNAARFVRYAGQVTEGDGDVLYRSSGKSAWWYSYAGMPFLARSDGSCYFLMVEQERVLLAEVVQDEPVRLISLPDRPPVEIIGEPASGETAAEIQLRAMCGMEASAGLVGLYSYSGSLFLLSKSQMGMNGHTEWWLDRIDPEYGHPLRRHRLPFASAHVTVIPGPVYWTAIEKERVSVVGGGSSSRTMEVRIGKLTLVPSRWLAAP